MFYGGVGVGVWVGFVVVCLGLFGFCLGFVWVLFGFCLGFVWVCLGLGLFGFGFGFERVEEGGGWGLEGEWSNGWGGGWLGW